MPNGQPWPRISIVTPSYNQGQFIEETIRSILLQGYPNLEYIIIDGGSSDNTLEVIKKYEPWLDYWISEPDRGQPHAINKGIDRCTGEIFNWINSDDLLMPGALAAIATAFHPPQIDIVTGKVIQFEENGNSPDRVNQCTLPDAQSLIKEKALFQQQGTWLRLDKVLAMGKIDEAFQYAFDWDLALRYLYFYPTVTQTAHVFARFRLHKTSKTVADGDQFVPEMIRILQKARGDKTFIALHSACDLRIRAMEWWSTLKYFQSKQNSSRFIRILQLLWRSCIDPRARWRRTTLRTIWRILMGDTTHFIH